MVRSCAAIDWSLCFTNNVPRLRGLATQPRIETDTSRPLEQSSEPRTRQKPPMDTATTCEFQIQLYVYIKSITPSGLLLIRASRTFIGLARKSRLSQVSSFDGIQNHIKANIHLRRAESDWGLVQDCHPRQRVTAALE
jgi:hypothetical protein